MSRLIKTLLFCSLLFIPAIAELYGDLERARLATADDLRALEKTLSWNLDKTTSEFLPELLVDRHMTTVYRVLRPKEGRKPASDEQFTKLVSSFFGDAEVHVFDMGSAPRCLYRSPVDVGFAPFAPDFAQTVWERFHRRPTPDVASLQAALCARLNIALPMKVQAARNGRLQIFRTENGVRAMFWKIYGGRHLLVAWFRNGDFTPAVLARILACHFRTPGLGMAFLPRGKGAPLCSPFIARRPDLAAALRRPDLLSPAVRSGNLGPYFFLAGPTESGRVFRTILLAPHPGKLREQGVPGPFKCVVISTLLFLGLGAIVERAFFARGVKLSVAMASVGSLLAVAILPLAGLRVVMPQYHAGLIRDQKSAIVRDMIDNLRGIDEGARMNLASFANLLKTIDRPEALEKMSGVPAGGLTTKDFFRSSLQRCEDLHFMSLYNFVAVASDGSAINLGNVRGRYQDFPVTDFVTQSMVERALERLLGPRTATASVRAGGSFKGIATELFQEQILRLSGPHTYINFIHFPSRVLEIKFSRNLSFTLETFYWRNKDDRSLIRWVWNQIKFNEEFLQTRLGTRIPLPGEEATFALQGNRNTLFVFPTTSMGEFEHRFPSLAEMANYSYLSGQPSQLEDPTASGSPVQVTLPTRQVRAILAGSRPTDFLVGEKEAADRKTGILLLVSLVAVVGISLAGAWFFLAPLRRLFGAVQSIRQGDFSVRLSIDRNDELGSLARAFNRMAEGLQEGSLLKLFVTQTVRDVVGGTSSEVRAGEGRSCQATIIFSSLVGFDAYQADRSPPEVFKAMENHLLAFGRAVKKHGGEIDKIIGEKVMVVLRHPETGDGSDSAGRALEIAREVLRTFAAGATALRPAIGINTGTVISGVIGASGVMLDHTVIGDPVNLAARLGSLAAQTAETRIVVSGTTRALLHGSVRAEKLQVTAVKGKAQEIEVFAIIDAGEV